MKGVGGSEFNKVLQHWLGPGYLFMAFFYQLKKTMKNVSGIQARWKHFNAIKNFLTISTGLTMKPPTLLVSFTQSSAGKHLTTGSPGKHNKTKNPDL